MIPISIPGIGTVAYVDGDPDVIRFDHTNLAPEIPTDKRFNTSIIESGSGYLLSFRDQWKHSSIYAARLNSSFKPVGRSKRLSLPEIPAARAHEDPRWFRCGGQLWLCYIGFDGRRSTSIHYARINEDTLEVEEAHWPQWAGGQRREKNWQPFDYQGITHFVYTIKPHVILRVLPPAFGEDPWAEWVSNTPFKGTWNGGYLRGGAAPVLHNGEWYSFFHGSIDQEPPLKRRRYNVGVYTFAPNPPFQILRYTPEPIAWADPDVTPDDVEVDVIFPCGAVRCDGRWCASMGVADTWTELRFYDDSMIEERLVKS
jgi:predicted GH43/DUF377 family glycosyl hydrolase